MKRLIKKADLIIDWIQSDYGNISNSQIDQIINSNSECIYDGELFRYISIDNNSVLDLFGGYDFMDENLEEISKEVIFDKIKKLIKEDDRYYSFSKSLSAARDYGDGLDQSGDAGIIISCNTNGLDVNEYLNNLNEDDFNEVAHLIGEEEVIAKLNSNYNIVSLLNDSFTEWPGLISLHDLAEAVMNNFL